MDKNNPTQPTISFRQKIILIICGIFFCAILLEVGLRIGGFIFSSLQEYRNITSIKRKGAYRIICLGESTTALGEIAEKTGRKISELAREAVEGF